MPEPSKRSKITDEHREEAAALMALWKARPHRTQAEFGEEYDLGGQANVGHYLNGRSALNPKAARAFATELKCQIEEFSSRVAAEVRQLASVAPVNLFDPLRGPGETDDQQLTDEDYARWRLSLADEGSQVAHSVSHHSPNVTPTIRVPLLTVRASMGAGADLAGEEEMVRSLSLSPQWISTALRPSRADALRFIHGHGDSMFPTFSSGDVLLVDTDVSDVSIPGVYVLEAQDQLFIKRVNRRLDGEFEISSDNPAHRTVEVLRGDHQVAVKGRVIWVWNGRKM